MRTRSQARRLRQHHRQQQVPPILVEPPKDTMADNRTMAELLQAPTEGYEDANCGNFLDKRPADCSSIIESKSKVRHSRSKAIVAKVSTSTSTSGVSPDVAELKDMVRALLLDKTEHHHPQLIRQLKEILVTAQPPMANPNQPPGFLPTQPTAKQQSESLETKTKTVGRGSTRGQIRTDITAKFIQQQAPMYKPPLINKPSLSCSSSSKLWGPGSIRYPCDSKLDECLALADLEASINLMPLSVFEKLNLQRLTKTRMILELADRSISTPTGIAEDVFVKVGTFYFQPIFVVMLKLTRCRTLRVPLIYGRPFLRTERACLMCTVKEMTFKDMRPIRDFQIGDTKNSPTMPWNQLTGRDFIDIELCEEYSQEVLGFSEVLANGNSFHSLLEPIVDTKSSPPTLHSRVQKPMKTSIDEPPEVELKDLPPHLEYAYLEGDNKLPVIIAKDLSVGEKAALHKG
ncbi:reverse transcriptase domain-containing protein [Tanacetum coccineum]